MDFALAKEYQNKLGILENTELIKEIIKKLDTISVTEIRCLGLGPISTSPQAMYQLCFLLLIKSYLEKRVHGSKIKVTVWDPIFSKDEKRFLMNDFNIDINEKEPSHPERTLYYMPHFPIVALENIITNSKPRYILGNNLLVYTFKFTDSKYFELYPNCARITKLIMDGRRGKPEAEKQEDGFNLVVAKKNKKRKQYIPEVVDYDFESAYFSDVNFAEIHEGNNLEYPWTSAFTDLAFFEIMFEVK